MYEEEEGSKKKDLRQCATDSEPGQNQQDENENDEDEQLALPYSVYKNGPFHTQHCSSKEVSIYIVKMYLIVCAW